MKINAAKIWTALILIFSTGLVHAKYIYYHDESLTNLVIEDPKSGFLRAQQKLKKAQEEQHVTSQLISLYYMCDASSMLSKDDEVLKYAKQGLALAESHHHNVFKADFLLFQTDLARYSGDNENALNFVQKAINLSKETDDIRLKAEVLAKRGSVYYSMDAYEKSIVDLKSALEVFKQYNDTMRLSVYYNSLALVYNKFSDYENAIKYLQESNLYEQDKSDYSQYIYYYNLGYIQLLNNDSEQGIINLNKAKVHAEVLDDESGIAHIGYAVASALWREGENIEAEKALLSSFSYFNSQNEVQMQFNTVLLMANIKSGLNDWEQANKYLNNAELILKNVNQDDNKLKYLESKADILVSQGNIQAAYELTKEIREIEALIFDSEKEISLNEAKVKFDAQFDNEKLKTLEKENLIQQASIAQEKSRRFYLLLTIVLFSIMLIIIFGAYRNQTKTKAILHKLTFQDDLTQISNRRHILEILQNEIARINTNKISQMAVIMIDLDYFKTINDTYGHNKGNEVLIHFASTAKGLLNQQGHVGRIGGEEWLVILTEYNHNQTEKFLSDLRDGCNQPSQVGLPLNQNLFFSSGALICTKSNSDFDEILKTIDDLLYQAKDSGRNCDVIRAG